VRFFIGLGLVVLIIGTVYNKLIVEGGLVSYCDQHAKDKKSEMILHLLGEGYEFAGNYDKMLEVDGRILERYPVSPYAEDAEFGVAFAQERLNRYPAAIKEYEKFLEKYPNSKYARSVRNNIEILKSR
jgi:tetratricopeptide (TPR) repeat protein